MARKHRFASPSLQHLYDRCIRDDPLRQAAYEDALANATVARDLYALRERVGLTQAALAAKVGTSRSVISRLEDAEYEGHSVSMLRRIAAALNSRVEIRFAPARTPGTTARPACGEFAYHVLPIGGGWKVERAGASRASGVFGTKREATIRARELAHIARGEVIIHGRDGRIQQRGPNSRDQHPAKDKAH